MKNDMTLYAIWKLVEYNINYELEGGSFNDKTYPKKHIVFLDEGVAFKSPIKRRI
ncbi:MAG: hypothetical protein L6V81_04330 [Clostridium sp.]|nr:MAG: hypothetical protein L6V81_04330 [Clostridium sp.]